MTLVEDSWNKLSLCLFDAFWDDDIKEMGLNLFFMPDQKSIEILLLVLESSHYFIVNNLILF